MQSEKFQIELNTSQQIANKDEKFECDDKLITKKTKLVPKVPDGGYGWIVVVASFFCNIIVDGIIFSFGIFLQEVSNDLQVSKGGTAWVGSLQTGFYLIVGPFVSFLANKYDCRLVTIIGGIISAIAFGLSYKAENIIVLCLTYGILGGIGYGFIYLPAIVIVGLYFDKKRAFATGIAVCGSGIGGFVLAPVVRLSVSKYGWRLTMIFLACVNLLCVLFALFFKPLKETFEEIEIEDDSDENDLNNNLNNNHVYKDSNAMNQYSQSQIDLMKDTKNQANGKLNNENKTKNETLNTTTRDHRNRTDSVLSQSSIKRPRNWSIVSTINYASVSVIKSEGEHLNAASKKLSLKKGDIDEHALSQLDQVAESKPLFDLSLLSSPTFLLFSCAGFLTLLGFFIPFMYIVDRAALLDIPADQGAMILSVIGITNTIGRVICGWFSDRPEISPFCINNVALIVGGIFTIILPVYFNTYFLLIIYAIVFGFSIACFAALRSIITTELFGVDRLTDAFGLLLLIQGIATMVGAPIAGWFFDITKSYNASFYAAGSVILTSGLLCIPLPMVRRWEDAKLNNQNLVSV